MPEKIRIQEIWGRNWNAYRGETKIATFDLEEDAKRFAEHDELVAAAVSAEQLRCAHVAFDVARELNTDAAKWEDEGDSDLAEHDEDRGETAAYVGRRILGQEPAPVETAQ